MEESIRDQLLRGLRDEDVRTRALTARTMRQVDLADADVLDAMLSVCRDPRPLPDDLQPPEPEDPFAEFFGEASARTLRSVAQEAADRLVHTGVIGSEQTVQRLAAALDEPDAGDALVQAAVKLLGETVWEDRLEAARALVPRLHALGAPLYAVIVRFGDAEHQLMVASALDPYHSRAVNELFNHQASKPLIEAALGDGIVSGSLALDEAQAADALTLLVSWNSEWAHRAAAALVDRLPWALLVLGIEDAQRADELRAWLQRNEPAPLGLVRKLHEVLKASPDLPHFPLDAWLTYAGSGVDVVRRWGAAARCVQPLRAFVDAWLDEGEHPERGWEALLALCEAGAHDGLLPDVARLFARPDEHELWTRDRFEGLAAARPPIPELVDQLTDLLLARPLLTRAVVPALLQHRPAERLRPLVERYLALCEQRPVVRRPSRKGLRHEEREGVDPVPLQQVVAFLDDEALRARLHDVLPLVTAEDA